MKPLLCSFLVATVMALPSIADEDAKKPKGKGKGAKGRNVATQVLKQLEPVGLTDEQTEKIKAIGEKTSAAMLAIHKEAGITPELLKKRGEAMKSLAKSDKKGKERQEAVDAAAGITKEHSAAFAKANELRMKMVKDVVALLTDEQKEKLPKQFLRGAGDRKGAGAKKPGGEKKPGGKKKDKAAA